LKFAVTVTLKKDVLDPQGKVVGQTLKNMGIKNLNQIRQGKYFEIDLSEKDFIKAKTQVKEMCEKLLANNIIEDFKINKSE
jgi:phosphoribosylformylglycinamidine synthase PurS subunit|tara:strand:- start:95 stop:337 length:243 start_codon:yes stop_codon:yes gene_type:complete